MARARTAAIHLDDCSHIDVVTLRCAQAAALFRLLVASDPQHIDTETLRDIGNLGADLLDDAAASGDICAATIQKMEEIANTVTIPTKRRRK